MTHGRREHRICFKRQEYFVCKITTLCSTCLRTTIHLFYHMRFWKHLISSPSSHTEFLSSPPKWTVLYIRFWTSSTLSFGQAMDPLLVRSVSFDVYVSMTHLWYRSHMFLVIYTTFVSQCPSPSPPVLHISEPSTIPKTINIRCSEKPPTTGLLTQH